MNNPTKKRRKTKSGSNYYFNQDPFAPAYIKIKCGGCKRGMKSLEIDKEAPSVVLRPTCRLCGRVTRVCIRMGKLHSTELQPKGEVA